ncbi:MAG TPA: PilZ domain-containing protein [Alphaproteobacteria bacterium]|nr:PilZ domain-containing protein [Alphaproteobacteria bacterium]
MANYVKKISQRFDQRRSPRSAITEIARIVVGQEHFSCVVIDISASGAKLWSRLIPQMGTLIHLDISNFGVIPATVIRRQPDGVGVEFRIAEEDREAFAERLAVIVRPHDELAQQTAHH